MISLALEALMVALRAALALALAPLQTVTRARKRSDVSWLEDRIRLSWSFASFAPFGQPAAAKAQ